jgi:hypothetical protein
MPVVTTTFLGAVRHIGDHTAADPAADLLTPELLAVGGVDRIKVAAGIATKSVRA